MKGIFLKYKIDTEIKDLPNNAIQMEPFLTVEQVPLRITQSICEDMGYKEFDSSLNEEEILVDIQYELSSTIAKKLMPAIKRSYSKTRDSESRLLVHKLFVDLVLPSEKLMYDTKEIVLKEMTEKANRRAEKYFSERVCIEKDLTEANDRLKPYLGMEKSIWKRIKFLFKGKTN